MAPPDMTRASDTQDQEGARRPGIRGWFQPMGPSADADDGETETVPPHGAGTNGHGTGTGPGDVPAQVPDETTVFPRIPLATDAGAGISETAETGEPLAEASDPAASADEPAADSGEPTAPVPVRAAAPSAEPGEDELPTADQAPLARAAVPRADDSELSTAVLAPQERADAKSEGTGSAAPGDGNAGPADIEPESADSGAGLPDETTVFLRVPPAGGTPPKVSPTDRPPDITRPQLILDDTMVDMAAVRPDQKPDRSGSSGSGAAAVSPAAGRDATSAGEGAAGGEDSTGNAQAGKSAKRKRSVFGPEPASRPDMLTNAETIVMASLKQPKGSMPGDSPEGRDAAANARN